VPTDSDEGGGGHFLIDEVLVENAPTFASLVQGLFEVEGDKSIGSLGIGDIPRADGLTPSGFQAGPGVRKRAEHGYKTIRGRYRAQIRDAIFSYNEKDVGYRETSEFVHSLMRSYFRKAYLKGMEAQAGSTKFTGSYQLTQEQNQWITSAADEEAGFFEKFMKDLRYKRTGKKGKMDWEDRVEMYAQTLDGVYDAGKVSALGELILIDWVLHPAEHCEGCVYLSEQSPFTKSNIPATPRDGSTQCRSNCKCTLRVRKVSATEYDSVFAQQTPRQVFLSQLRTLKDRKKF